MSLPSVWCSFASSVHYLYDVLVVFFIVITCTYCCVILCFMCFICMILLPSGVLNDDKEFSQHVVDRGVRCARNCGPSCTPRSTHYLLTTHIWKRSLTNTWVTVNYYTLTLKHHRYLRISEFPITKLRLSHKFIKLWSLFTAWWMSSYYILYLKYKMQLCILYLKYFWMYSTQHWI